MSDLGGAVLSSQSVPGPRTGNEDRVLTAAHGDGSWVIAVADGFGGNPRGYKAAEAALAGFPDRVGSASEMLDVVRGANARVAALSPGRDPKRVWSSPLTTLAVAAWSEEGGLLLCSVGDSMVAVIPPVGSQAQARLIGAAGGRDDDGALGNAIGLHQALERSDIEIEEVGQVTAAEVAAVICATDGAWEAMISGLAKAPAHAWADVLQRSPEQAASALVEWAGEGGLTDDASAAVAVVLPPSAGLRKTVVSEPTPPLLSAERGVSG